jgi:hypothetical protein
MRDKESKMTELVAVRLKPETVRALDEYRRGQLDLPSRAEAIRRFLVKALEVERGETKPKGRKS